MRRDSRAQLQWICMSSITSVADPIGQGIPFDPQDPDFLADPYPVFARLRQRAGVHSHTGLGMPVAVSHAAASQVLRGRGLGRIWSDAEPAHEFANFNLLHRHSLLESEPP